MTMDWISIDVLFRPFRRLFMMDFIRAMHRSMVCSLEDYFEQRNDQIVLTNDAMSSDLHGTRRSTDGKFVRIVAQVSSTIRRDAKVFLSTAHRSFLVKNVSERESPHISFEEFNVTNELRRSPLSIAISHLTSKD